MDEEDEDEGRKNVELEKLFLREDSSLPYFIDLKVADTYTCRELALESITRFNEVLNQ
jgi:hypothetical protein